jgi:hypothetical protein
MDALNAGLAVGCARLGTSANGSRGAGDRASGEGLTFSNDEAEAMFRCIGGWAESGEARSGSRVVET